MDNVEVKWGNIISAVNTWCIHSAAVMYTIANQSQRTICRLLVNKKRTSSQTSNIVGQQKMLANICLSCVRGFRVTVTVAAPRARYHKAEAEVEAKAKTKKMRGRGRTLWGRGRGRGQRCRINYKLLIWIQLVKYCNYTVMIVSSDSVNAIVLPLLTTYWQLWLYSLLLADKYSVTDGCDSFMTRFWWFTTRPWGPPKWERGQRCTRLRSDEAEARCYTKIQLILLGPRPTAEKNKIKIHS